MKIFLFFILLTFLSPMSEATSPSFEWKVLRTSHFEILYNKPQRGLALQYAFAAEESYRTLATYFSDLPQTTVVVLDDSTDLTNGSATFLPYDWITIYPALPNPGDSLDHYGFWPTAIMIHELTHIANFQPVGGFYLPLLYLMGRIVTPNTLLPRWYLEGLAVDSESRFTSYGRLRSSRTQGILRALSKDQAFDQFKVDQINEVSIPTWPFGERPYYFGSLLQKSLVDRGEPHIRERWNQRYGRRVPFLINAVPEEEFQKSFSQLLEDLYLNYDQLAQEQIKQIQKEGSFKTQKFQPVEHEQLEPTLSPDGKKLIYISRSYRRSGIWMIPLLSDVSSFTTEAPTSLLNVSSPLKLEWAHDSSGFYFDEVDLDSPFVAYRKIYFFNILTNKKTLITPHLRAQEPALHPKQTHLAYIGTTEQGLRTLEIFSLSKKSSRVLYQAPLNMRLSRPLFLSNSQILFVQKDLKGQDSALVYDLQEKKVKRKIQIYKNLRQPSALGGKLLFLSDQSGVDNLYITNSSQNSAQALSNTQTWIHSYAWLAPEKSFVISQMTSKGLKLFKAQPASFALSSKKPLVQFEKQQEEALPSNEEGLVQSEGSFYPFKYLIPRYWIPFVYPLDGGLLLQGSTSGNDPVGVNQYVLSGSYDTLTSGSSYGLSYVNNSFPMSLGLGAAQYQEYLGASDSSFEKTNLESRLFGPLGFLSQRWMAGTGYSKSSAERLGSKDQREGPEVFLNYSSLLDRRYSEFGQLLSLSYQKFLAGPDRVEYDHLTFSLGQKYSFPFKGDHSAWLGLKGAFANQLPLSDLLNFGDRSLGANYLVNLTESQYLYRGYPSGSLVGRQLLNANLEYRFPIKDSYKGNGTQAMFFKTLSGVIFVDAMAVDGAYYNFKTEAGGYYRTPLTEIHPSTGAELRLDTTLAYHLPITFILGGYYGLSRQMGENFSLFLGIGGRDPLSEASFSRKDLEFAPQKR